MDRTVTFVTANLDFLVSDVKLTSMSAAPTLARTTEFVQMEEICSLVRAYPDIPE